MCFVPNWMNQFQVPTSSFIFKNELNFDELI